MKLTKDMFDFEKYEYFTKWAPNSNYLCGIEPMRWQPPKDNLPDGLYRREKPPPRYILLNEGEKLEVGDEYHAGYINGWSPGSITPGASERVRPKEIWRRKPDDYIKVRTGEIWRRKVQE